MPFVGSYLSLNSKRLRPIDTNCIVCLSNVTAFDINYDPHEIIVFFFLQSRTSVFLKRISLLDTPSDNVYAGLRDTCIAEMISFGVSMTDGFALWISCCDATPELMSEMDSFIFQLKANSALSVFSISFSATLVWTFPRSGRITSYHLWHHSWRLLTLFIRQPCVINSQPVYKTAR